MFSARHGRHLKYSHGARSDHRIEQVNAEPRHDEAHHDGQYPWPSHADGKQQHGRHKVSDRKLGSTVHARQYSGWRASNLFFGLRPALQYAWVLGEAAVLDTSMPHSRKWHRFSLRALLVAISAFAIWFGLIAHRARQQRHAIDAIEQIDGYYYYDFQFDRPDSYFGDRPPPGPRWVWRIFDPNLFFDVVAVGLNSKPATDDTLTLVSQLSELQILDLAGATGVTNLGLSRLESLRGLSYVRLDGTAITEAAIEDYGRTHPTVEVVR
jgi:hypothetical protein